jgi:hypothetical protein
LNALLFGLLIAAIGVVHLLVGGRHVALCLPSYGLLSVAALLSWWHVRRVEIPRRAALALAVGVVFFGYVVVRTVLSPEEYLARKDLYLVLGALIVYLLVALNITSSRFRVGIVLFLLLLASAHVAVGAIQFTKGQNFMPFSFLPRAEYGSRASGFFSYPNHLAGFLEIPLLMGMGVAFWSRWRPWAKFCVGYFIAVCVAGIVMSGSRGGYISSLAGLLVFGVLSLLVVSKRIQKHSTYIMVGGALLAVILAWSIQRGIKQDVALGERVKSAVVADSNRVLLWKAAIKQFESHPVFGTGSGIYLYYGRQFRPLGVQADPVYAHNDYVQFLAEYGIVGAIGLLAFLACHIRGGWRAFGNKISRESQTLGVGSNSLALSTGALSATAACMVHSFVDFNLHSPANALVMAFVFGVLANPGGEIKVSSKEKKGGFRLGRQFRLVTPVLGLCMLVLAMPKLPAEIYAERARRVLSDGQYLISPDMAQTVENYALLGLQYDLRNPELYYYLGEAGIAEAGMAADPVERTKKYSESVDAYRKAVELAQRDTRLLLCLATSLDALQRFGEAAPLYVRVLETDPKSIYGWWAYGMHLELQQNLDEAEAAYRRSYELGGGPLMGGSAAAIALDRIAELRKKQPPAQAPGALDLTPSK